MLVGIIIPEQITQEIINLVSSGNIDELKKCLKMLKLRPEHEAQVAGQNNTALREAIKLNNAPIVECLLEVPAVLQEAIIENTNLFFLAARFECLEVVSLLLQYPEIAQGAAGKINSAILTAAESGYPKIVAQLLENPEVMRQADCSNNFLFLWALTNNHIDIVKSLLDHNPKVLAAAIANKKRAVQIALENAHQAMSLLLDMLDPDEPVQAMEDELVHEALQGLFTMHISEKRKIDHIAQPDQQAQLSGLKKLRR